MNVRELMSSPAYTCRPQDSLQHAARMLWEHDCGMLPVVDAEGRVGAAITDRDICMAAFTKGLPLSALRVADCMSRGVVLCRADEDVAAIAQRMAEHQLHRLPVVDALGRPIGVVALNDLVLEGDGNGPLGRAALQVLAGVSRRRAQVPAVVTRPLPAAAPRAAATPGA